MSRRGGGESPGLGFSGIKTMLGTQMPQDFVTSALSEFRELGFISGQCAGQWMRLSHDAWVLNVCKTIQSTEDYMNFLKYLDRLASQGHQ